MNRKDCGGERGDKKEKSFLPLNNEKKMCHGPEFTGYK